jgi:hypothetical protein
MSRWKIWFHGLAAAFIGGGATTASAWMATAAAHAAGVDVPMLNVKALGIVFAAGGLTNALAYLKQSPLPVDTDEKA